MDPELERLILAREAWFEARLGEEADRLETVYHHSCIKRRKKKFETIWTSPVSDRQVV